MHDRDDAREIDAILLTRVYGEYIEMPGLRLTLAQASRLWNVKLATSAQLLDRLVDESFLRRAGNHYVRANSGRASN